MPASRAFSITAIDRGAPPLLFCSCARRSAADNPAGPPPTISTSTSSVSRSAINFSRPQHSKTSRLLLQLGDDCRCQFEQIALHAVVGDFENRRFGILVDRHDGARSLHAHQVL